MVILFPAINSGWREIHFSCKFVGSSAASLKLKKVLFVVLELRLLAFFNFASPRSNHQIFALKAVSRQPLDTSSLVAFFSADKGGNIVKVDRVLFEKQALLPLVVLTQDTGDLFATA